MAPGTGTDALSAGAKGEGARAPDPGSSPAGGEASGRKAESQSEIVSDRSMNSS
jgi:hypothetical protein